MFILFFILLTTLPIIINNLWHVNLTPLYIISLFFSNNFLLSLFSIWITVLIVCGLCIPLLHFYYIFYCFLVILKPINFASFSITLSTGCLTHLLILIFSIYMSRTPTVTDNIMLFDLKLLHYEINFVKIVRWYQMLTKRLTY